MLTDLLGNRSSLLQNKKFSDFVCLFLFFMVYWLLWYSVHVILIVANKTAINSTPSIFIYTMPWKIQPRIRIQERVCILDGITSNLSIKCLAYVALTVLATVCSTAWYKIVMQHSLVVYHEISHLSLVFSWYTDSSKGSCTYTEKIQVSCGIFHGIP